MRCYVLRLAWAYDGAHLRGLADRQAQPGVNSGPWLVRERCLRSNEQEQLRGQGRSALQLQGRQTQQQQ